MLTLDNLLAGKHAHASFYAGVQRLLECSLFSARLLSKDADLLSDLLQNHQQIYAIAEMQHFLDEATKKPCAAYVSA